MTSQQPKNKIQLPVLFRLLYSCGLRVTEALMIRMKDVDPKGIIDYVSQGFAGTLRCPVRIDATLLKEYADKTFYLLGEDDFIFQPQG